MPENTARECKRKKYKNASREVLCRAGERLDAFLCARKIIILAQDPSCAPDESLDALHGIPP
jgi:hypothetical protein